MEIHKGAGLVRSACGLGYRLRAGQPGLYSRQGQETFLYTIAFILALWPTQLPIKWVPGALLQE
jgi:hypothetical protein